MFGCVETGEIKLSDCNYANVPVNVSISENKDEDGQFYLTADNYMPRKGRVHQGAYTVAAKSRSDLRSYSRKYILPLYGAAIDSLTETGEVYYWE